MIRITLIILCLTGTTLYSMDMDKVAEKTTEEAYDQHIIIANPTTWPLVVLFTSKTQKAPAGLSLIAKGEVLLENPSSLETIKIVPSGKVYGKLQLREPQDLIKLLADCIAPESRNHYLVTIQAPSSETLQYISPFTYEVTTLPQTLLLEKLSIPESRAPIDAFPEVKAAFTNNKIPFARHYLGISLSSRHIQDSLPSIYEAYQRRTKRWLRHEKSYPNYTKKVLELLEQAYTLLNEELTLNTLLKEDSVSLPVTLKKALTSDSYEELSQAETRLTNQWNKTSIAEPLRTKTIAHLQSEYELISSTVLLYEPIKEIAQDQATRSSLRRSQEQEELLDLLLDPTFLRTSK